MVAIQEHYPRLTPEEYFAWEEQQELRHEYLNGEIYAMTGGTVNHSEIASNFNFLLKAHLQNSNCRVLNSDARLNIHESKDYVYPDLSVTCDDRDRLTPQYISHPCLITEVLSPSTAAYDQTGKFKLYRRSPSLINYVLINSEAIEVDVYHINDRGRWEILNYLPGDTVELESINLTLAIEQIYQGIIFTPNPTEF